MNKLKTLLFIFISLSFTATAQNHWMYLPNNGFYKGPGQNDSLYRLEDIYFTDTTTGYAVTMTNKILKTIDGGHSWQAKNDTSVMNYTGFRSIEFLDDGQYGVAGSLGGQAKFWRTADYGESWNNITSNISDTTSVGNNTKNICGIAHFGNTFYAVGSWGSKTGKLYKSTDKGQTWQTRYMDTTLIKGMVDVVFLSQDTGFVCGSRNKESIVLKTTDGGNNWTKVFGDTTIGGRIWKLQFLNKDAAFGSIEPYFTTDTVNMISSYNGGNSWNIIHVGRMPSTSWGTQGIGFISPAKGWVGGYYNGIFETNDSGKTWAHINFGYDFNRIFIVDSTHVFGGGHMPYKYGSQLPNMVQTPHGTSRLPHDLYPVSPNPTKGKVKIEFELKSATNVLLQVINTGGRLIYPVCNAYLPAGHYNYYWDGSYAPEGNYIIWLGTNEIPVVQKFVLLK